MRMRWDDSEGGFLHPHILAMKHLLVDISGHGYGHVSQTAPVVNALVERIPKLQVTVRCDAPEALLRQRLKVDFDHLPLGFDFGMKMASAVEVLPEASHAAYRELHLNWAERVADEAARMAILQPDLLLANVPYLSLAAAQQAGIPAVALCSLNWADIYHHYCQALEGADVIHRQMLDGYSSAKAFLRIRPAMPMADLPNLRSIGSIATPGRYRHFELAEKLGLGLGERCVLVAMGGMEMRLPMESWPRQSTVRWLVPGAWGVKRDEVVAFDSLDMPFGDILASCDAVLTKPGYGTFAEAACAGVPVLYAERRDWPESEYLADWLTQHVPGQEVSHRELQHGRVAEQLAQLWAAPVCQRAKSTGCHEAAEYLAQLLE